MRDYALILLLALLLPVALARPFAGAMVFGWLALMNPHRLTWGIAGEISWSLLFACATIAGTVIKERTMILDSVWRYRWMLAYVGWMGVTTLFALSPEDAAARYWEVLKVQVMCIVTLALLNSERRIKAFALLITLSIGFYGLKGGIFTLLGGGEHRVWGPTDTAIADNNHLAVGLAMTLPLIYWIMATAPTRPGKVGAVALALLTAVAIFGTHSRSGFVALAGIAGFLWIKSDRKLSSLPLLLAGALAALLVMPDAYWARIASISDYSADASALGRINAWRAALNVAQSRLTGAGFEYYKPWIFATYAPEPDDVHSSHSVYFQALGEHGWIGFALFMVFWFDIWRRCAQAARHLQQVEQDRALALLTRMIQVGIIGLATGGAFVNIGNWDFAYYLAVLALAIDRYTALRDISAVVPHAGTRRRVTAS